MSQYWIMLNDHIKWTDRGDNGNVEQHEEEGEAQGRHQDPELHT